MYRIIVTYKNQGKIIGIAIGAWSTNRSDVYKVASVLNKEHPRFEHTIDKLAPIPSLFQLCKKVSDDSFYKTILEKNYKNL